MNSVRAFLALSFIPVFFTHALEARWPFGASQTRQDYNREQLKQFKSSDKQKIIITDLHDVLFTRQDGDIGRAWQLSAAQFVRFAGEVSRFGARYVAYKVFGWPSRVAVESYVSVGPGDQDPVLKLLCPFQIDQVMANFYRDECGVPVFACSNIGPRSWEHMKALDPDHLRFIVDIQHATGVGPEGYIQKDSPVFYQRLAEKIEDKLFFLPKAALMIDDERANIERAREFLAPYNITVYGYHFKNTQEFLADYRSI